jgi:hypothetical protein
MTEKTTQKLTESEKVSVSTTEVAKAYLTAEIGKKVKDGKMKLGDSTFWLLRKAYETGDENTKQAILTVVKELVNLSSDGKEAVQAYWIDHIRDEALKEPGKQILAKQENGDL